MSRSLIYGGQLGRQGVKIRGDGYPVEFVSLGPFCAGGGNDGLRSGLLLRRKRGHCPGKRRIVIIRQGGIHASAPMRCQALSEVRSQTSRWRPCNSNSRAAVPRPCCALCDAGGRRTERPAASLRRSPPDLPLRAVPVRRWGRLRLSAEKHSKDFYQLISKP